MKAQGKKNASWNNQVWNLNSPAELNMPWQCQWTWENDRMLLYAQVSKIHAVSYCKYCSIPRKGMLYVYIHFFCLNILPYIAINYSWVQKICNKDLWNFSPFKKNKWQYIVDFKLYYIFLILVIIHKDHKFLILNMPTTVYNFFENIFTLIAEHAVTESSESRNGQLYQKATIFVQLKKKITKGLGEKYLPNNM